MCNSVLWRSAGLIHAHELTEHIKDLERVCRDVLMILFKGRNLFHCVNQVPVKC